MNKKIFKNILIISFLLFGLMINNGVYAAGSFSLNKSSATITVGKTATFTINGSNATGKVTITSSDTSVATVSSSSEWLEESSVTITITAKKAGTATITVTGEVADSEGIEDTVTKSINVTVKEATSNNSSNTSNNTNTNTNSNSSSSSTTTTTTKSNNAYLSTLGVTPKDYDFSGFSKTKYEYSVTVPSDVDSLKVLYKTADSKATVNVSGNSGFEVGSNNKITVKVTAEDGKTTKTYTIKVTQLAEEEEKPGNLIDKEEELFLTSLSLKNIKISPEFAKDVYSYTATIEDSNIIDVEVNAKANEEKAKIEISGNTDLVVGENTINIVVSKDDSTNQVVYQIVLTKVENEVEETSDNNEGVDFISSIKKYVGIAIAVVVLIIIAVIVLVVLLKRENRKINEEDDVEEKEEYDVYKNDENEFENKNFIESLYKKRNGELYNEEELDEDEKKTLDEINKETDRIFNNKEKKQSEEYTSNEEYDEDISKERKRKGRHSL